MNTVLLFKKLRKKKYPPTKLREEINVLFEDLRNLIFEEERD